MLLNYKPKHDHIKCVPLIAATPELAKLKITRGQVQLLPGINEVSDDEWEIMKAHFAREIDHGEIRTIEAAPAQGKKVPGGKAHDLKDLPANKAVAMVGECVNHETLLKWHREETRDEVRLAVVERMKELKIEIPKYKPDGSLDDSGEDEDDGTGDNGDDEKDLDKMTVKELEAYAAERNIAVSGNKAEIIAAIKEAE
jgi:hypothetical protein